MDSHAIAFSGRIRTRGRHYRHEGFGVTDIDMVLTFRNLHNSDLHVRADEELEYEVGRRSVSGNTDRFTFLFRKPVG